MVADGDELGKAVTVHAGVRVSSLAVVVQAARLRLRGNLQAGRLHHVPSPQLL